MKIIRVRIRITITIIKTKNNYKLIIVINFLLLLFQTFCQFEIQGNVGGEMR